MSDVARLAGVHPATVSRALKNDPRITPEQRARVHQAAQSLGYRPNPLVAALMSMRRTGRPTTFRATIAYVTKYSRDRATWFARAFGDILPGARERARLQGYQIEEINLADPAFTPTRTTEILAARGILGAIIAPLHAIGDAPALDWIQISAVAIGLSLSDVPVTRAAHNHFLLHFTGRYDVRRRKPRAVPESPERFGGLPIINFDRHARCLCGKRKQTSGNQYQTGLVHQGIAVVGSGRMANR